jgi:hypothetical protein
LSVIYPITIYIYVFEFVCLKYCFANNFIQ